MSFRLFDIKRFAINDGPGIRTTIFIKGCPLHCAWCHNPEGISSEPQMMFTRKKCIGCKTCMGLTDEEAAEACPTLARQIAGKQWTMDKLMTVIEKERKVMEDSDHGGVTICGGEPLLHYVDTLEILRELGKRGFHRCVDTSLYAPQHVVDEVASECELMLIDIKHMDSSIHSKYTGVPNEKILSNIKHLADKGTSFWIRVPLIEGINADEQNIGQTAAFIASLQTKPLRMELLPYHDIGKGKHERLGTIYNPTNIPMATPSESTRQRCIEQFAKYGIKAII